MIVINKNFAETHGIVIAVNLPKIFRILKNIILTTLMSILYQLFEQYDIDFTFVKFS